MSLTTKKAAARLGVNTSRIRQLILAGRLKATKDGRDWRVSERSVDAYARQREKARHGK